MGGKFFPRRIELGVAQERQTSRERPWPAGQPSGKMTYVDEGRGVLGRVPGQKLREEERDMQEDRSTREQIHRRASEISLRQGSQLGHEGDDSLRVNHPPAESPAGKIIRLEPTETEKTEPAVGMYPNSLASFAWFWQGPQLEREDEIRKAA